MTQSRRWPRAETKFSHCQIEEETKIYEDVSEDESEEETVAAIWGSSTDHSTGLREPAGSQIQRQFWRFFLVFPTFQINKKYLNPPSFNIVILPRLTMS